MLSTRKMEDAEDFINNDNCHTKFRWSAIDDRCPDPRNQFDTLNHNDVTESSLWHTIGDTIDCI